MERHLQCLTVLLVSALCSGQIFKDDPCDPDKHNVLNQTSRSTGYTFRPSDTPQCDNRLKRGWYTFTGITGKEVEMPTECPGTNTCGTNTPIWLDGKHPTPEDGIVTRRLCGKRAKDGANGDCCGYEDELFVVNCRGFYVYYLNPTFECPSAYCAGTAKRCPANQWSSTNFEPCKDLAPVLDVLPVVKGPNVNANQTFDLKCEIVYGPNDPDQVFSVAWTFNNQADPAVKPQILAGNQRVATLTGDLLKKHIEKQVRCVVTTYYSTRPNRNTYTSNPSLIGVQDVTLTGPILQGNKKFYFECEVTFGSDDPDQRIEVIWTFDDKQDPKFAPQIVSGPNEKATLDGSSLRGHLNSNVGCQARLVFDVYGVRTAFRKSKTYFAGIQVSTNSLVISDSDGEKDVTVTSTIPVVCDQGPDCCLTYKMTVDKTTVVSLKNSCDHKICFSDWDDEAKKASVNVTLVPSRNSIGGVNKLAVLSFTEVVISGTGPYCEVFEGYKPTKIQITVKLEVGFKCSITADPHIQGFDYKRIYDLYRTGDYTVYLVKERDFLVQIRTWPCWAVTCVCGVAVKEKNDIIRVRGCDKPGRLISATVAVPYKLSSGASVKRSANGQHVGITLQSGSEIKIDINNVYMNVFIQTPAYDRNKAIGICGTNDGIPGNDFTHPDGTVTPVCTGAGRCIPVQFTESWKVTGNFSLFVTTPAQVPEQPSTEYCSCRPNSAGKLEFFCSASEHIQETGLGCQNCQDITESLKPSPWGQPGQEEKPFEPAEVNPVDPNQKWPNAQGVTEAQARNLCNQAIQKSQLYSRCSGVKTLVEDARTECLGDILNGGTTEVLDAITSSFTSKCQLVLSEDERNYKPNPDGVPTLNPDIGASVCPVECADHGKCGAGGKCACHTEWEGETCQIEKGKGPQITYTTGGPLCHASQKPCDRVQFDKSNVNIFDKLKCRIQPVDNQGRKIGEPVILDAVDDPSTIVSCPLPTPGTSTQNYTISVTKDGITYGNELLVQTFDPTCLDCVTSGCTPKKTACHINNVCYKNGEKNQGNQKQVCDVSKSTTAWSPSTSEQPKPC